MTQQHLDAAKRVNLGAYYTPSACFEQSQARIQDYFKKLLKNHYL